MGGRRTAPQGGARNPVVRANRGRWGVAVVEAPAAAYAWTIVVWQVLRLLVGDRWWWLALANIMSLYLFLPLLLLWPLALVRRRSTIVALTVPTALFLWLYGGLFLPRMALARANGATAIRVMTLNVMYRNKTGEAIGRLVRAKAPDLVCLQELTPPLAEDLEFRLQDGYPYRVLLPEEGVTGLGVFSRYPLQDLGEILDAARDEGWEHGAQVISISLAGQEVLVLNVHALSPDPFLGSVSERRRFERVFQLQEEQVRLWLDRVVRHEGPAIVAGDLNMTDQNRAYRLMVTRLRDAHREAGWGLGHTVPASREGLDGWPLPDRLFRIDYVWASPHWQILDARVGDWDGQSDHLPVLATLQLPHRDP
ncbi:MAG: endonuclease/exonuclease/phosphatase family protein [Anaerolineae bacterium]